MIHVPAEFTIRHPVRYPGDNTEYSEEWYRNDWKPKDARGRAYLPIQWTAYQCNGGNPYRLAAYLKTIQQPTYTICQHDDGIYVPLADNIKVFAMSSEGYPLPLLCTPHRWDFNERRDIFASFAGANTHPLREQMKIAVQGKRKYRIEFRHHQLQDYCRLMARSVFALCPRGYGRTSFRIGEAIQYGAIPVYISDQFIFPYDIDFNEYGVVIPDVRQLDKILSSFTPEQIAAKQKRIEELKYLFTYKGMKEQILKVLEDEMH